MQTRATCRSARPQPPGSEATARERPQKQGSSSSHTPIGRSARERRSQGRARGGARRSTQLRSAASATRPGSEAGSVRVSVMEGFMADRGPKIRLFVEGPLAAGAAVATDDGQTHYLARVMRLGEGAEVAVFDGVSGEWAAEVEALSRKAGVLRVTRRLRAQTRVRDLELLFAPVKKARTDFIVEKACELGVRRVRPVWTDFVNAERLKAERLRAHMVEAAEQCGYLGVPALAEAEPLSRVLDGWDPARRLVFCDERRGARP